MKQIALIVENSSFKSVSANCWPTSLHSQEMTGRSSPTTKAEDWVIGGAVLSYLLLPKIVKKCGKFTYKYPLIVNRQFHTWIIERWQDIIHF